MKFLRGKIKRAVLSIMVGIFVCSFFSNVYEQKGMLAWWGVLYPDFCMVEAKKMDEELKEDENTFGFYTRDGVRISFWLAKVFDW